MKSQQHPTKYQKGGNNEPPLLRIIATAHLLTTFYVLGTVLNTAISTHFILSTVAALLMW